MADFLDDAQDTGLLSGLVGFGGGFIKGMENAEDRKYKRMEFEAKQKAHDWEKEKKQLEAQQDKTKRGFEQAGKLRDDWLKNDITKRSQNVREGLAKMNSASPNAAGDMSLIYGFMKIQDPGSSVKEGEYAQAEQTRGIPGWITGLYNKAKDGQILTPQQRAYFKKEAQNLYAAQKSRQDVFDEQFRGLSNTYGINPNEVVLRIFEDPQTGEQKIVPVPAAPSKGEQFDQDFQNMNPQQLGKKYGGTGKGLLKGPSAKKPAPKDNLDSMSDKEIQALYKKKFGG